MQGLLQPDNNNERNPSGNEDILMRRQVVRYAIFSLEQMLKVQIVKASGRAFNSAPAEVAGNPNSVNITQESTVTDSYGLGYKSSLARRFSSNDRTPVRPASEVNAAADITKAAALSYRYRDEIPLTSGLYSNTALVQPKPEDSFNQNESIESAREQIEEIRREEQEQ